MVKVQIPGTAWQRAADGQYPMDEVARWHRLTSGSWERKYGRSAFGRVFAIETDQEKEDIADLRDYLDSVAGAMWSALPDQRGNAEDYASVRREAEACTLACERITAALNDGWKPAP